MEIFGVDILGSHSGSLIYISRMEIGPLNKRNSIDCAERRNLGGGEGRVIDMDITICSSSASGADGPGGTPALTTTTTITSLTYCKVW